MRYRCAHCRGVFPAFHLACPECGAWNASERDEGGAAAGDALPVRLRDIRAAELPRLRSGIAPLDELLGEGFVAGSSLLLTGAPGAGKSTLLMQILGKTGGLYATGEESVVQLKVRANRLKINSGKIYLLFETNLARIAAQVRALRPALVVVDSIQTVYTDLSDTLPGSSTQIRKCTYVLRRLAQERGTVLVLIGQVTKGKGAAGPRLLEHAVDAVLTLDAGPDGRRALRATKNRFGPAGPPCILLMERRGLVFRSGDA